MPSLPRYICGLPTLGAKIYFALLKMAESRGTLRRARSLTAPETEPMSPNGCRDTCKTPVLPKAAERGRTARAEAASAAEPTAARLRRDIPASNLLFVTRQEEELSDCKNALEALAPLVRDNFRPQVLIFGEDATTRSIALEHLFNPSDTGQPFAIFATYAALRQKISSPEDYSNLRFRLRTGSGYKRQDLLDKLEKAGYERTDFTESPGEYAIRGSVIDIFCLEPMRPVRLFFSDNILESARFFEVATQHTCEHTRDITVIPAKIAAAGQYLKNCLPDNILCLADGAPAPRSSLPPALERAYGGTAVPEALRKGLADGAPAPRSSLPPALERAFGEPPVPEALRRALADGDFGPDGQIDDCLPAGTSFINVLAPPGNDSLDFGASQAPLFRADTALVEKEIIRLRDKGFKTMIFCLNRGELERLTELFSATKVPDFAEFRVGRLSEGFQHPAQSSGYGGPPEAGHPRQHPGSGLAVITSSEILGRVYRPPPSWKYRDPGSRRFRWNDLKTGDFVVHEDYGIGRYMGIRKVEHAGQEETTDCLLMEYRGGDRLFVPLYEFKKVQKYIGGEGKAPRLSSMDTRRWQEIKTRVRKGVEDVAKEILRLEAERALIKIRGLGPETHLEKEFAGSFPYEETADQLSAINSIMSDMSSTKPMNRVVVGDVGFGKTEVAMRAAFKCAVGGKQAAVLVPTTILADQHCRTFKDRFAGFPVNIAVLSRFQTGAEQKKVLKDIRLGLTDIVIGTHRLLQKDVSFKDLGLIVVDEEHRFGVKDKEKLKELSRGLHILMLSATPIPRTLYQALSSLRDISVIESPPTGRQPISTEVLPWDIDAAVAAISAELARGGQVYYVHNRVSSLPARLAYLKGLMPEVRFCMAHGRMTPKKLEETMWDFFQKKHDVLLASTIIESGLDIPSVNTLIVENAHEFGLAQLYQLRGRIGREKQKAFCCLFYPQQLKEREDKKMDKSGFVEHEYEKSSTLRDGAAKRLSAIKELAELGSGFRLAMRDMEIRGAGELLGVRQHGFINEVGVGLYCELLAGEIGRLKGKPAVHAGDESSAELDIRLPAFIPDSYLSDDMERLNCYKKLLNSGPGELEKTVKELEDLCGPAPEPVRNISVLIKLRKKLSSLGVRLVNQTDECLEIFFRPQIQMPPRALSHWQKSFGEKLVFIPSKQGDGVRIFKISGPVLPVIESFIAPLLASKT
ncbi:MAG: DEAD/DEAH box helicase [bacterium]